MSGVIAHDWISRVGGAEKVLDAMVGAFPTAEVWCLWNDDPVARYPSRTVRESWLARTPLRRHKAAALPLMPATWRTRQVRDAEWVLASSHLFAHHVRVPDPAIKKYAYVYTPARYIWHPDLDERGQGLLARLASPGLRALDRHRAHEAYRLCGISEYVRDRIRDAWGMDAAVIYPPVNASRIVGGAPWADRLSPGEQRLLETLPETFLLGASRFIPYKRLDQVIATGEAARMPVVLAGSGPELSRLRRRGDEASIPVTIVGGPTDSLLYALYEAAYAYVFPAVEDFGIMPVEAMASGTPVIVPGLGGASETVVHGLTGAHVDTTWPNQDLATAVAVAGASDPAACKARALTFDERRFAGRLRAWVSDGEPDRA